MNKFETPFSYLSNAGLYISHSHWLVFWSWFLLFLSRCTLKLLRCFLLLKRNSWKLLSGEITDSIKKNLFEIQVRWDSLLALKMFVNKSQWFVFCWFCLCWNYLTLRSLLAYVAVSLEIQIAKLQVKLSILWWAEALRMQARFQQGNCYHFCLF